MHTIDLTGKCAVVTGAKQGIGFTAAVELAKAGADVAVIDLSIAPEDEVCVAVRAQGRRCLPLCGDVSSQQDMEHTFERLAHEFGGLDILINNAGITKDAISKKMTAEQFNAVLSVNLTGTFLCSKEAMQLMRKGAGGAAIVNVSSMAGFMGNVGQVNYSATKAGVIGMTKTLALEGARDGIRVNAVVPGFIETAMTQVIPENIKKSAIAKIPLARMGSTEDIANAMLFLVSDMSSFITGTYLHINGGRYM